MATLLRDLLVVRRLVRQSFPPRSRLRRRATDRPKNAAECRLASRGGYLRDDAGWLRGDLHRHANGPGVASPILVAPPVSACVACIPPACRLACIRISRFGRP